MRGGNPIICRKSCFLRQASDDLDQLNRSGVFGYERIGGKQQKAFCNRLGNQ